MGRKPKDWQEGLKDRYERLEDGEKNPTLAGGAERGAGKAASSVGSPKTSSRGRDWAGKAARWAGS
jgi:hypothetical protein